MLSILIPTWNNLAYLRLCVRSIRENSEREHQIVLHINEGSDGTLEWAKESKLAFTHSEVNIGVCKASNSAYKLAESEYIVYANDDMYFCPEWDTHLLNAIEQHGGDDFYFSSTLIEPRATGNAAVVAPVDFGDTPETFNESALLAHLPEIRTRKSDWWGSSWPPSVMHRRFWDRVGGFSEEYFPGYYSDPDLSMKLWRVGVREFRGIGRSLVYHFMSKSTGKVAATPRGGYRLFMRKWGIRPSYFYRHFLRIGQPVRPGDKLKEPHSQWREHLRVRLKSLFT